MKTFTHGDKEEPVHVVWYKRWWVRFRGNSYNEDGHLVWDGTPLIRFTRGHGMLFNDGGRYLTISIGGRHLLYRLYLYIPILKWDLEFKATLYAPKGYASTAGQSVAPPVYGEVYTSPAPPIEPVGRNPYMPQSYVNQLQGIGG